jgi:hypothetical protein
VIYNSKEFGHYSLVLSFHIKQSPCHRGTVEQVICAGRDLNAAANFSRENANAVDIEIG